MSATLKSMADLVADRHFLGNAALDGPEWAPWRAALAAASGVTPDDPDQQRIILECTGRTTFPDTFASELWCLVGRRGGKSRVAAFIGTYLAVVPRYTFAPGERGTLVIVAADRKQAKTVLRYIEAYFRASEMLWSMVAIDPKTRQPRINADSIDLTNGVTIEVLTANFRSLRSYTVVGAICDELAFWPNDDSSNPDEEILAALRPAMATVPNAMLVCISSVHARKGEIWNTYRRHFGTDGDPVLVWKAPSRTMNPTLRQSFIDSQYARDPARASAEYGSDFRSDVEGFLTREAVDACTDLGCFERPPTIGQQYAAFVDPAGGSGADSMTLGIAHRENGVAVLDLLRERKPPFSPESVVREFCELLATYGITRVTGDHYSGEWVREEFGKHQVVYDPCEHTKSALYGQLLPRVNSSQVVLLEHARLNAQLCSLERRTARGGRDSIDHPPGQHDDVANAAAGALSLVAQQVGYVEAGVVEPETGAHRARYDRTSPIGGLWHPSRRLTRHT